MKSSAGDQGGAALQRSNSDGGTAAGEQEATSVRCECCGMAEECTPRYIVRVREHFHGKWVCGLCSEAVKERQKREPALTVDGAVDAHAALCERFNSTVRLNPKLSLASSMRDIARKSCQHRATAAAGVPSACSGAGATMARSTSCALPYV
ncbi:hypothetical protein E2562_015584 [Oryza meyeriana var. granulata]|uniref:DUF1677 family protein n=1 Tax=Oryza meyeriana var. granulata TaxID=110450 RepID=A0A6G1EJC6_9ORYZ|nr:hypothetical protein E2562_015584 [Oryza meyeriana var. granulata]